jgi:hypothetical protein
MRGDLGRAVPLRVLGCLWGKGACRRSGGGQVMSRVIAIVACGLSVAACSGSMPSLNFLSSSSPTDEVRFESEPPGAEVRTGSGQACRTPCELTVAVAPELSATFALNGYQSQTVSLRSDGGGTFSSARLAPNPVYVELSAAPPPAPAKKHVRKKPAIAKVRPGSSVASAASDAPAPATVAAPTASGSAPTESAASATNYPWPEPPKVK